MILIDKKTQNYWTAYSGLETELRDVARMVAIARFYANEIEWPKERSKYLSEEIDRLLFLVGHIEEMAESLVKLYDKGFGSGAGEAPA